ncbi:MAG: DUF3179 domain-containing protein [Rhodospirillaceae bacterium]|nr:DUF3179 domain-containing protein [Rhodospirillaceae bacterium]
MPQIHLTKAIAACAFTLFAVFSTPGGIALAKTDLPPAEVISDSWTLIFGSPAETAQAAGRLAERGRKDVLATATLAMRYSDSKDEVLGELFRRLTGEKPERWTHAQLWLETHPEITPHESYRALKLFMMSRIDPKFLYFLGGERTNPTKMKIRLEEVTWGGVKVDGIPSLDNPTLLDADSADYLVGSDEVFGVAINGDVRAYPLRIMGWHEMFNDTIGGVPVALAYCTLCGSGILYETQIKRFDNPLVFGSSGFLYRSNKLMFDRHTLSLWNQFTGKPVAGPLVDSGIELKTRAVTITTWAKWLKKHPKTKVLSLDTGHLRDYASGAVYNEYFASPSLMFPARVRDEKIAKRKDYVFGLREAGGARAWPLGAFEGGKVINDAVGLKNVVLVGDAASRTVRAYYRQADTFQMSDKPGHIKGPGGDWRIDENFLISPDGAKRPRAPGGISYWFAWENYLGDKTTLYGRDE